MAKRGELKWGTVENLENRIESYFEHCDDTNEPPNVAGLCLALDVNKDTYFYYSEGRYEERLSQAAKDKKQELIEANGEANLPTLIAENGLYKGFELYHDDEIDIIKARVSDCLKKAKLRMEAYWWQQGSSKQNPAFPIFALKALFHYTDQPQQVESSSSNLNIAIKIEQKPLPYVVSAD